MVFLLLITAVAARPARHTRHSRRLEQPETNEKIKFLAKRSLETDTKPETPTEKTAAPKEASKPKRTYPTSGCEEKTKYLKVCYSESRITYQVGNPAKGKMMDDDLEQLSSMYAIYHLGRVRGVSDIQYDGERETSKGKRHKFCKAPPGSEVIKVRTNFVASKKRHTFKELEFIWRTPDGSLYECGVTTRTKSEPIEFGDGDDLTFLGFRVLKADKYIRLMEFEFGRSVPGLEAKCSTTNVVAVVDEVLSGMVTTESLEEFEGTTKIQSTVKSMSHEAGVEVKAGGGALFAKKEVTAKYSFTHSTSHETGTEKAISTAKTSEISIDLTDKLMVSYYLMIPCLVPEKVQTDSGKKVIFAPFDHRMRRLILPVDSCISETETVTGTKKKGKVDLVVDGSVDLNAGSCVLPKEFIWFDEKNLMNDISHLVDIKGSGILNDRDSIPVAEPQPAHTIVLR